MRANWLGPPGEIPWPKALSVAHSSQVSSSRRILWSANARTLRSEPKNCGRDGEVEVPHRFAPTEVEVAPPLGMDLARGDIGTIIWATGFRPDYSWLDVPVFDRKGQFRPDGGIVDSSGMYLMGMQFLRRRKSVFFDGAGDDARDLSQHLAATLAGEAPLTNP